MPYITAQDRSRFVSPMLSLWQAIETGGLSNGDLNYLMSRLGLMYIEKHGKSYNTLSDVIKAFECAKLEFYRRQVAPYEDTKIASNGDVTFDF